MVLKPVNFDYLSAKSVEEVLQALSESMGTAKIIAGGQSLMPILNMRLARPEKLIDICSIPDLDKIEKNNNSVRISAIVRHQKAEGSPMVKEHLPLLAKAIPFVGHTPIRSRGTLVGSVVHADPSAEIPLVSLLLDAYLEVQSLEGSREVALSDFFFGYMMTDLQPDEMVTALVFPEVEVKPGVKRGTAFQEMSRREGDFAIVSAACQMDVEKDIIKDIRIGLGGVGGAPIRLDKLETSLVNKKWTYTLFREAAESIGAMIDPEDDPSTSAEYRLRVATGLIERVLTEAFNEALAQEEE
jgi:2-furoyl-CoA dehydrogenase FAD binding subunit